MFKIISFDLQGTISDLAFSNAFWFDFLPTLYADKKKIPLSITKKSLSSFFHKIGPYEKAYYSVDYWLQFLSPDLSWEKIHPQLKPTPRIYPEMRELIHKLSQSYPLLIFSATTKAFLLHELGDLQSSFKWIISSLDDLDIAGKPPEAYAKLAKQLGVEPSEILHIGDDIIMDIQNSQEASWKSFYVPKSQTKADISRELHKLLL